jgi:hypothetical protein
MQDCQGKLTWTVTTAAGDKLRQGSLNVDIPARKSRKVDSLTLQDELKKHGAGDILVWLKLEIGGRTVSDNMVSMVYPKELKLVEPKLTAVSTEKQRQYTVTLTAAHPALWAWIELDGIDARCSQNFVHVTADRPVEITVSPARPLTQEAFQKALRVRSLYDTYAH